jgi:beta-glucuronidase
MAGASLAQNIPIQNVQSRNSTSLNGYWNIIIDPYENGYYNYRYQPSTNGYFKNYKAKNESELVEYNFDLSDSLRVPGDWNTQKESLFFYEGTIWYKKSFDYTLIEGRRLFINFGAVNYHAIVYINGEKVGEHRGGFTQFCFEITGQVLSGNNFVVVKVDNKRLRDGVPTLNTDWWNYGGITRDVTLIETPPVFIQDYSIQLAKGKTGKIKGRIKLNGEGAEEKISINIPELHITNILSSDNNHFEVDADPELWSPENPKLYEVQISRGIEVIKDKIGFRTIETEGSEILLNNKPVFLKGISIHEESPVKGGRANTLEDARKTLGWVKELGCNFVRLAHYPHNENIIRVAEEMGIMVWSEIPVYWTILWDNNETYANAENQLIEMITRDKNRANVIIWSVANETPRSDRRLSFLSNLITKARSIDPSRLISAATELSYEDKSVLIDDPLSEKLDVIGANEYIGWYSYTPSDPPAFKWTSNFNKPLIISEFGGGALKGNYGNKETRWTEEYQEDIYINQVKMCREIPFLKGISPWILVDFRSPRRPLPNIQDFWNRKGLISDKGEKKKAFYILRDFYMTYKHR